MRHVVLLLAVSSGCGGATPAATPQPDAEWVTGPVDLRAMTALVRPNPAPGLREAFDAMATDADGPRASAQLSRRLDSGGSGFIVVHRSGGAPTPFVITNRHVVEFASTATVKFGDGATYESCPVVYFSPTYDIAVLALPAEALTKMRHGFRPSPSGPVDMQPIFASGYPAVGGVQAYRVSQGKISNAKYIDPVTAASAACGLPPCEGFSPSGEAILFQHTAPGGHGISGGPVTDGAGTLLGVNEAGISTTPPVETAIPASAVIDTVREAHATLSRPRTLGPMQDGLDLACRRIAVQLRDEKPLYMMRHAISVELLKSRGPESYTMLKRSHLREQVENDFYKDPLKTLRHAIVSRLSAAARNNGGATGTCTAASAASGDIERGGPVHRGVQTKDGREIDLVWTFERGQWRLTDGALAGAFTSRPR